MKNIAHEIWKVKDDLLHGRYRGISTRVAMIITRESVMNESFLRELPGRCMN